MLTEIDGSILEGGGQILRIAISLSVLRSLPIKVSKIRAGRSKPGLAAQHLMGIQLAGRISKARLQGDTMGSTEIIFEPSTLSSGDFSADTKTAGSVGLLLQVALPCCLFSNGPSHLTLIGGTNAEMAPQIDYTLNVFRPILRLFGADFECDIEQRGFFPAGKGILKVKINPVTELKSINLTEFGQVKHVYGEAFVAGVLPFKVAEEMAYGAKNILKKHLHNVSIDIKPYKLNRDKAFGNGSGINIFAETTTGCVLGGSSLGRRGISNDEVARKAVEELLSSVQKKVCLDSHLQDQVIIFMALAKGKSRVMSGPLTLHSETAIHISQLLTKAKFNVIKVDNDNTIIECEGIGQGNENERNEL